MDQEMKSSSLTSRFTRKENHDASDSDLSLDVLPDLISHNQHCMPMSMMAAKITAAGSNQITLRLFSEAFLITFGTKSHAKICLAFSAVYI